MATQKTNSKANQPAQKSTVKSKSKPVSNLSRWYPYVIALLTLLLYSRTVQYQFVKMDDADLIVQNEVFIRHLKNLPQAFRQSAFDVPGKLTDNKSYYRPVLIASLMLDAQFHSARPALPYHVFNLIYHILACLLLYFLLLKLCKNPELSLVLSLLFALHPVNTHAVAWILGRNDLLLAIFTLWSFHKLIDYYNTNKTRDLILHLLAFTLAIFTKESGVLLLVIYFLFMLLWQRDALFFWRKKILSMGYIVITVLWYMARTAVMQGKETIGDNGSIQNVILHNIPYLFLYIGKILLPFNLNVEPGVDETAIVLGCISLLGLGVLFYFINDRRRALFSIIWYFIFIVPTLLVPVLPAYEHRDYLPLIGILIGISQTRFLIGYKLAFENKTYIFLGIAILFFILTSVRLPVFENAFTFWENATENTPFEASGDINVGHLYQEVFENTKNPNALKEASTWALKGLKVDSTIINGNNNYGACLYFNDKKDEAAIYFQKEIKFHPTDSDPYKNMGIYYREKGEPEKSVYYWKKLISMNHYNLDAYQDLANYYKQIGDTKNSTYYATTGQKLSDESEKKYNKLK